MIDHRFKLTFHNNAYVKAKISSFSHGVHSFCFAKFGDIISCHAGEECAIDKMDFISKTKLVLYFNWVL